METFVASGLIGEFAAPKPEAKPLLE